MSIFTYKAFNLRRDKLLISVTAVALALYLAFSCSYFVGGAKSVREDVVRLHILANSDSSADQAVKLKVRDALLNKNNSLLNGDITTENAKEYFNNNKAELLKTANAVLRENGFIYNVDLTLEEEYFETRTYGDLVFPAGEYTALKVILGEGKGHNWWCVMFPPLCVPAADGVEADKEKTADYLSESGDKIVKGGNKYIIKFKLLEWYEKLKSEL